MTIEAIGFPSNIAMHSTDIKSESIRKTNLNRCRHYYPHFGKCKASKRIQMSLLLPFLQTVKSSQNPNPTVSSVGFILSASHSRPCAFSEAAQFLDQLAAATSAALSRESSESAIPFVRHALQASQSLVCISLHLVNTCPTTDQVSSLAPAADSSESAISSS